MPLALTSTAEPGERLLGFQVATTVKAEMVPGAAGNKAELGWQREKLLPPGNRIDIRPQSQRRSQRGGKGRGPPLDSQACLVTSGLEQRDVFYNCLSHINPVLIQL